MIHKIIWFIIFLKSKAYIVYDVGWITYQSHLESFEAVKLLNFHNHLEILLRCGNEYQFFCETINTKGQEFINIRFYSQNQISWVDKPFDDLRIEIINVFNLSQPKGNTYPHKNPNAQNAILSLLSFGCTGPIDFKIFISKITKDQITVDLINNVVGKIENLKQIGFQILIGIEETIKGAQTQFVNQPNILFNVFNVNSIPGNQYEFVTAYLGFMYDPNLILSVSKKNLSPYPNNTFDYTVFIPHTDLYPDLPFTPCTCLSTFIIKYFKTIFTPLILQSAQITQKSDQIFLNNPQICIKIEILNKIITQPEIYQTLIDKSIKTFNLQIEINCKKINKVESNFQNCQDCVFKQNYSLKHYCSSKFTLLTFKIQLTQSISAYQQLTFTVEQSRFNLKQVLTNQIETEVVLIDIQFD